jgi:3-(3-hydroxy-phenyl)propionate hydroxylase
MPDLDISTSAGPTRVYALLHDARPLLLRFGQAGLLRIDGWDDRVKLIDADVDGACALPVIGPVALPAAVLIRPDGHVAWAGGTGSASLSDALEAWFGRPSRAVS